MTNPNWFTYRDCTSEHEGSLSTVNPLVNNDEGPFRARYNELDKLFQFVFDEQAISFDASGLLNGKALDNPQNIPEDALLTSGGRNDILRRYYYILKLLDLPMVHHGQGQSHGSQLEESAEKSIDEFFQRVFIKSSVNRRSSVFSIVGDVGSGKSSFLSYILSSHLIANSIQNDKIWFIRINLQQFYRDGFDMNQFCLEVVRKVNQVRESLTTHKEVNFFSENDKDAFETYEKNIFKYVQKKEEHKAEVETIEYLGYLKRASKRNVIIILDNIDFVFHENDEIQTISVKNGKTKIKDKKQKCLFSFITVLGNLLSSNRNWSKVCGAILIILRKDSYSLLEQLSSSISAGGGDKLISSENTYSLHSTSKAPAQLIILKRLHYLAIGCRLLLQCELINHKKPTDESLIELPDTFLDMNATLSELRKALNDSFDTLNSQDEKNHKVINHIKQINALVKTVSDLAKKLSDYEKNPVSVKAMNNRHAKSIDRIVKLSGSGLRDAIRVFKAFSWVQQDSSHDKLNVNAQNRIFKKPNLAIMVQASRHRIRFSEHNSHFPNVFLAYTNEERPSTPDYWLIPMIVDFLKTNGKIRLKELLEHFCDYPNNRSGEGNPNGFYDIISFCKTITRLQRIQQGPRLLQVERRLSSLRKQKFDHENIELTPRAKELFHEDANSDDLPLVADFLYTQLVIDDPKLPLPPETHRLSILPRVEIRNKELGLPNLYQNPQSLEYAPFQYITMFNYSYLVREDYPHCYVKVMGHKLRKVVRFMGLLKAAQEVEMKKYVNVWGDLSNIDCNLFNTDLIVKKSIEDVYYYAVKKDELPAQEELYNEYKSFHNYFSKIFPVAYGI